MRSVVSVVLALGLCLASGTVFADDSPDTPSSPPAEDQTPAGPVLQPADYTPVICDPSATRFRFLEVRGSGFDAWATQHLVGNVADANGVPLIRWSSIWVSPQGRLILEVNLCADPFQNRPALEPGDYTVSVGPNSGAPIAATGITLAAPPEPSDQDTAPVAAPASANAAPTATPLTFVIPNLPAPSSPTPLPVNSLAAPTATPGPRVGPGSLQQPYPPGAPGNLVDGWQLVITGVTPDAYTGIHAAVPSAVAPASDQRDFLVRAQATYLGPGTGVFSGVRIALMNNTGTIYDQLHNSCGVIPDSIVPNVVTNGTTVRGNVCFTVRASDLGTLVAYDNQTSIGDRVYFALQ